MHYALYSTDVMCFYIILQKKQQQQQQQQQKLITQFTAFQLQQVG